MARIRFFPRRSDDREDINPFNAGDPVMPHGSPSPRAISAWGR